MNSKLHHGTRFVVEADLRTPNGIRTRAATLKGWCPRPLDDGGKDLYLVGRAHEIYQRNQGETPGPHGPVSSGAELVERRVQQPAEVVVHLPLHLRRVVSLRFF